jgi:hypothetical protein
MKLVLTGLSHTDEAALTIFLGRAMDGWSCQSVAAAPAMDLPEADIYVLNLLPLGLSRWSEAAQTRLLAMLDARPAVLLVPGHDRSWATHLQDAAQRSIVFLSKPYGTEDMRVALQTAAKGVPASPPPVTPTLAARPAPAPVVASRAVRSASKVVQPVLSAAEAPHGLSVQEFQDKLAALPQGDSFAFLRKLDEMLSYEHPFEARFTVHNLLLVHPAHGWVASNTPLVVIARVCQSAALASAVEIRELAGHEAEDRMQLLGLAPSELDLFLLNLWNAVAPGQPKA